MKPQVSVLWLAFVLRVYGDNIGDCGLAYNDYVLSLDEWKFGFFLQGKIPDNVEVGKTVATFQTVNISGVSKFESQFFHPNFNSSTSVLTLSLSEALDESKYSIQSEISFKIYFNCFRDTADIYMYMEVEDVNDHKPEFSTQTYIYNLPMPFPSGIDITSAFGDIFVTDDDFTNTKVDFSIDSIGKKYFNVSSGKTDSKKYFMILKSKSRIDLHENISFSITATDNGVPSLQSNALVTITANSEYSIPSSPIFLSPIYISSVDEINLSKTIPLKIVLDEGYGTNLTLQLKDIQSANWSKYFTADINGSSFINIHLIEQLPTDLLNFTNAIIIVEVTSLGAAHTGQSVLLITGPCSPSSTDYPPTEAPTTAPCPGIPLHFDKVSYTVLAKKNQFGMLTQFTAVSDHQDEIEFGISSDSELVKKFLRIGPKDGFLYADEPLTNNTEYYFNVTAKIISTKELASAKVELSVFSTASIETPRFNKSLEYHYITEENIGETIEPEIIYPSISVLPCNFEIKTQNPLGNFFSISSTTGIMTVVNKIDRENGIFSNMSQAVIKIQLQIICSSEETFDSINSNNIDVKAVSNDPLQTTLIIYIDDVNDNIPSFSTERILVGYPMKELTMNLQPKSITTVKAIDKDDGLNAEIKYSLLKENSDVMVHPSSGAIYPLEGFQFKNMTITILAEDKNGGNGSTNSTVEVEIKILKAEEISILWIEDAVIEDLDDILTKLKASSKYSILVTDSAVVSDISQLASLNKNLKSNRRKEYLKDENTSTSLLRLIVYALDNNGMFIPENLLLQGLANTTLVKAASTASTLLSTSQSKQENTFLIAIIIILASVLIIVLLSATIALYYVYVRPRKVNGLSYPTEFSSKENITSNMEPSDKSSSPMEISESENQLPRVDTNHTTNEATPVITLTDSTHDHQVPPAPSEKAAAAPRERKISQPVRGDLIPDPDKLLHYRKHKPKEEEDLPDPTVPGGGAPLPREPRQPGGEPVERKRSTVRFSPVVESIDK